MDKPEGQPCPAQRRGWKPCSIYEARPEPCREFSCAWLVGVRALDDGDRPDKLGVVVDVQDHPKCGPTFKLFPVAPRAFEKPRVKRLVRILSEVGVVLAMELPRRRLLGGPPHAVENFKRLILEVTQ